MTYPQIGNYGINLEDAESREPHIRAFVIGELCEVPSNWRSCQPLSEYLAEHGVLGIEDIDTRALTKHLRSLGAMRACVSTELSAEEAIAAAKASPSMEGSDFVKEVSTAEPYQWQDESREWVLPNVLDRKRGPLRGTSAGAPPHRGLRFRHQVQHPAPPAPGRLRGGGRELHRHRRRGAGEKPGRHFPLQRPRRSRRARLHPRRTPPTASARSRSSASASETSSSPTPSAARPSS